MYQPNYTITDKLLNSLVRMESSKVSLEKSEISSNLKSKLKNEVKTYNLFHLAHILGVNLTVKDSAKLAEGRNLGLEGDRGKLLNNFRGVMEFNRSSVAESYAELDLSILLHLNKLILNNWKEPWDVKIRTAGEPVNSSYDSWAIGRTVDDVSDITIELNSLIEWYSMSGATVHPIIRIGVLVERLIELMPFTTGNMLTILSLVDYLFVRHRYSTTAFIPGVRGFDLNAQEYIEAWTAIKVSKDLSVWLERFVRGLDKDVNELRLEVDRAVTEEREKNSRQPFLDLNKRQLKILKYLQTIPTVKREDYCQMMDVSTMTAYRDLDDLTKKKLIKVDGKGRGTKYMLVSR